MANIFTRIDADQWTVGLALEERANLSPDAPFLSFANETPISFGDFRAMVGAATHWLSQQGVRRGEIVGLALPNSTATIVWWFALNVLGAVDAAINPSLKGQPLAHALSLVRAKRLITSSDMLAELEVVSDQVPHLDTVWIIDAPSMKGSSTRRFKFEEAKPHTSDGQLDLPDHSSAMPADVATIIYTSGTTGPAKAVQMTHAQIFLVAELTRQGLWLTGDDSTYCAHPLFHMAARDCGVLPCFLTGGQLALDARFDAARWVDRMIATQATATLMHGPLIEMVYAQPPRLEDSQMMLSRLGSSPFPRHIADAFEKRFNVRGIETWGMTEIGIPAWHPISEPLRAGSCGKIRAEWYDFRVADPETGQPLADGSIGEFQVRSTRPHVMMAGYLGQAPTPQDEWFHTGDYGHRDADGWLWFASRAAERIRRRAENISPYEIESAASGVPEVEESAAIGVPSEFESDDDILLCLLARPGNWPLPVDVLQNLARQLPHHMLPRYVWVMHEFPRSPTGKIRKDVLKKDFSADKVWDRTAEGVSVRSLYAAGG